MDPTKVKNTSSSPYGSFRPGLIRRGLILLIRKLPANWLGKRLMFALRRIAGFGCGEKIDIELFGFPMRLHTSGNVSERRALFAPQFFDQLERRELALLAEDNALFIDIGANIGLYSFSTAVAFREYSNTRILAIEPHPTIAQRFRYNLSLNSDLPIELIELGIGDREGTMKMVTPSGNLGESHLIEGGEARPELMIEVKVKTLMNLLAEKKVKRIDGMKIDIEGYEEAALAPFILGAPDELLPKLIVLENNYFKWEGNPIALIESRGYITKRKTRMNLILQKV